MKSFGNCWLLTHTATILPAPVSPSHDLLISIPGTHYPPELSAQAQIHSQCSADPCGLMVVLQSSGLPFTLLSLLVPEGG